MAFKEISAKGLKIHMLKRGPKLNHVKDYVNVTSRKTRREFYAPTSGNRNDQMLAIDNQDKKL